jgi:predicted transcriptional regulator
VLSTLKVGDVFNRNAITLVPRDPVTRVIDHILTSYQPDFAVIEGNKLVGVVTRKRVLDALSKDPNASDVSAIMDPAVPRVDASQALDEVHDRMTADNLPVVAVYQDRDYLGLVSLEDLAEAKLVAGYVQRRTDAQIRGE